MFFGLKVIALKNELYLTSVTRVFQLIAAISHFGASMAGQEWLLSNPLSERMRNRRLIGYESFSCFITL